MGVFIVGVNAVSEVALFHRTRQFDNRWLAYAALYRPQIHTRLV